MLKKKSIKIYVMLIIALIGVFLLKNNSFAANSVTLNAATNKTEIKQGESLVIELSLTNINAEKGVTGILGLVEYDENIFESCQFASMNGWGLIPASEGTFTCTSPEVEPVTADSKIATVTLKAKSDAKIGQATIKLTGLSVSYVKSDDTDATLDLSNMSKTIKIVSKTDSGSTNTNNTTGGNGTTNTNNTTGGNGTTNTNNTTGGNGTTNTNNTTGGNGTTNTNNITGGNGTTNKNNTTGTSGIVNSNSQKNNNTEPVISGNSSTSGQLPKTGIEDFLIIGIVIAVISSVVFYLKYRKY